MPEREHLIAPHGENWSENVTISLPVALATRLRRHAKSTGLKISGLVKQALEEKLR